MNDIMIRISHFFYRCQRYILRIANLERELLNISFEMAEKDSSLDDSIKQDKTYEGNEFNVDNDENHKKY